MRTDDDRASAGGDSKMDKSRLERTWDEVQALNRAAGPWGTVLKDGVDIDAVHRRVAA